MYSCICSLACFALSGRRGAGTEKERARDIEIWFHDSLQSPRNRVRLLVRGAMDAPRQSESEAHSPDEREREGERVNKERYFKQFVCVYGYLLCSVHIHRCFCLVSTTMAKQCMHAGSGRVQKFPWPTWDGSVWESPV